MTDDADVVKQFMSPFVIDTLENSYYGKSLLGEIARSSKLLSIWTGHTCIYHHKAAM